MELLKLGRLAMGWKFLVACIVAAALMAWAGAPVFPVSIGVVLAALADWGWQQRNAKRLH